MATAKWRLKGKWLKNCNCNPGCPCDFWAPRKGRVVVPGLLETTVEPIKNLATPGGST